MSTIEPQGNTDLKVLKIAGVMVRPDSTKSSCIPKLLGLAGLAVLCMAALHSGFADNMAHGHSMFNSAEEFIAGYRVQVATAPEFPQLDEPSMFLVRVTDADFEEVDRFTMGIRFFYNGQQIDAVPPTAVDGGHWDFGHTWRNQGNHIVKVDLYDMADKPGVTTYTFNMGTQSPFGYIFIIAITVGAFCFAGVMFYIYIVPRIAGSRRDGDRPAGR